MRSAFHHGVIAVVIVFGLAACSAPCPASQAESGRMDRGRAIDGGPPKREFRGVWLTTLGGLDWPPPAERGDPARQQASLRRILDDITAMRLNAVIFQVRSRGNAFYPSRLEPWASELTGTLGRDPGWDPLAFAIAECRARGLEVHLWFNVFRIWSGDGLPPSTNPPHVARARPEWTQRSGSDIWLDPGIPEARDWCAEVAEDLVRRYDADAFHLDYVRYPDANFSDDATWARYGGGAARASWRRDNVSAFVRDVAGRISRLRPAMRLGSAPIGIYENLPTARGWQGFHAVSQDARRWLREGWCDYAMPQVYWGLRERGSSIDFSALVRDWTGASAGRMVAIGTAPYRPEVKSWLGEHIDACRANGADGVVFFRYEHVRGGDGLAGRFDTRALPPAAVWRDPLRPHPPRAVQIARDASGAILSWSAPVQATDGDTAWWYAVYRGRGMEVDIEDPADLLAVLPATSTTFHDAAAPPDADYLVTSLDRAWNESEPAGIASGTAAVPAPSLPDAVALGTPPVEAPGGLLLLTFAVPRQASVRVRLLDADGAEAMILVDETRGAGVHVIGVERARLPGGLSRVVYEIGPTRILQSFDARP